MDEEYQDVFAWTPYEAPGVDPEFASHALNVSSQYKPVVQKARRSAPQHAEAVREEVERLLKVGAIREILYPQWLSNTVVVKKKNGKWRVCVDFTDLNKACPKDPFPLPKIDQLVDSTAGHERMSFLDAFQGYHQIALKEEDQEKTAFITPRGIFCYKVMPFGLKNAGATYQRMVTKMFSELLGKTVEVYIDDMVVKSVKSTDHIGDLEGLRRYSEGRSHSLKLNATKCAFGVGSGKFLGFLALFRSSDFSGRISKWGAHLGAYDVHYKPRTSIKGQVLADFVAEFAPEPSEQPTIEESPRSAEQDKGSSRWTLYVDGAANSRGSGLGVVLISPEGEMLEQAVRLGFGASNNEAEYEALLHGLRATKRLGAIFLDLHYLMMKNFDRVNIERVGREHNGHADSLAGLASAVAPDFRRTVIVEVQDSPSIMKNSPAIVCQVEAGPSWMDPILNYLTKDVLPEDQKEAAKIRRDATRYWVSREGKLYKKSYTGPYLLCVHPNVVPDLLYEIHEGVCGGHTGGRSLAHRAIGQGYWWPYMQKDAAQYVRRCEKCQLFAPAIHKPASQLNPISSPWPFAQWGLDLVGPLPRATGNRQWLIVATDYFTKWVEAEPLARITDSESRKFVWKNIITRFGIPRCFISDNGTQFDSGPFKKYCSEFGIRNHFSSPAYPQGNGQAESSNKTILNGIKKRLEEAKGRWVEELPTILWTFRTTPRSSTGETPYSLTYGVEAVIPLEVGLPTLRSEQYDQEDNELMLAKDMDLAQERRDLAMIRLASYQGDLKKRYGRNVNARSLAIGDMVLRRVLGSRRDPSQGKLGANWEGPYQIVSEAGLGAFNLKEIAERQQNPGHAQGPGMNPQVVVGQVVKTLAQNPGHAQWYGGTASKPWPRPGALMNPQVKGGTKPSSGVSVNPQVWWDGIKTLATPRCSTYESSSGMVGRHKTLAMLPMNPQVYGRAAQNPHL
uniref:Integrase catalytic domain-containing protein n=1 Tax=Fagus sylvatica TaxID=28930 RepID=A0A2N9FJ95_FAGSY